MQVKHPSPLRLAWYRWKAMSLPWRKRRFVGYDFNGNTFWIFRDPGGYVPVDTWRRIVQAPNGSHLSELKVPPVWHQWLRHVRPDPPTIDEQIADISRQQNMAQLSQLANTRWAAKPRVADMTESERRLLEEARKVLGSSQPTHAHPEAQVTSNAMAQPNESKRQAATPPSPTISTSHTSPDNPITTATPMPVPPSELKRVKGTLPAGMADPWANAKNPGENWQPDSWVPPTITRR
ncbi:NADH ubiquinone oxidoreductase subunit NDUFA12 [Ceratocystis platani]|uniref:NADH ubiquinone oxidoreductase subunit NDUFA12 n=1 Tax=Ceratocystis fimbriata f. sp. platani TaxID=88771 RepID=A0A0F8B0I4_CERFI|nr:NADH ubiquinone oxidoreductase subunit NDUFA12 [Ceratocystis platani]